MPLKNYGVLKARPVKGRPGVHANAHYQVKVIDDNHAYRIAVNVRSKLEPSELEFLINDDFQHPITDDIRDLPLGFRDLEGPGLGIDYIRGNVLDMDAMVPLPFDVPGPDNDLNEAIDARIRSAIFDEDALVYAFGELWGPEPNRRDKVFGFQPGYGIHDIHMNQGNHASFRSQDAVWQDGALLVHHPGEDRWIAVFLKFQSQSRHTDDRTGHTIEVPEIPVIPDTPRPVEEPTAATPDASPAAVDGDIRIVAALPNPTGPAPEQETVTLLNTTSRHISLTGWGVLDRNKHRFDLQGTLESGETVRVVLPQNVQLGNKGGAITLLNASGLKVHGVSYTRPMAVEGRTIVF